MDLNNSKKNICKSYLEYGYCPNLHFSLLSEVHKFTPHEKIVSNLVSQGIKSLNIAFEISIEEYKDSTHIVPLSGGLDSRTILAVLLKKVEPENIKAITFGTPNTWDYKYGRLVADTAGVSHHLINLSKHQFTEEELLSCAVKCDRPTLLFERAVNVFAHNHFSGDDVVHWSGFMADPLAGAHLPIEPIENWEDALDYFVEHNRVTSRLTPDDFDPKSVLPSSPITDRLEFTEQLDYAIRQPCFIKPTVLHPRAKTPFLNEEWVSFCMRLPRDERVNRRLFKKIVLKAFPELFSLPTDANHGLRLTAPPWKKRVSQITEAVKRKVSKALGWKYVHPAMNYLDFESAFRTDMFSLIDKQLDELKRRKLVNWIDIDDIWNAHLAGEDFSDEIRLLVGLEFFLKASKG